MLTLQDFGVGLFNFGRDIGEKLAQGVTGLYKQSTEPAIKDLFPVGIFPAPAKSVPENALKQDTSNLDFFSTTAQALGKELGKTAEVLLERTGSAVREKILGTQGALTPVLSLPSSGTGSAYAAMLSQNDYTVGKLFELIQAAKPATTTPTETIIGITSEDALKNILPLAAIGIGLVVLVLAASRS